MQSPELYKRYRPKNLKQIVGQTAAKRSLNEMIKSRRIPHTVLLTGPSGCGKTTIARILKKELECADQEFYEINCALADSVMDTVRAIGNKMRMHPMMGPCIVWYLDEVQSLTRATFSQQAMLKMLEDTPDHVYFILATTDPQKLNKAIRTRSTEIQLQALSDEEMRELLEKIAKKEKIDLLDRVLEQIIEYSEGSARKGLVLLNQIMGVEDEDEQLKAIESADERKQAIDLCRMLLNSKATWPDIQKILTSLSDEPENVRRSVLGYASSIMLKTAKGKMLKRAALVIEAFESDFLMSGKPGLVNACYTVFFEGE